MKRKQSRPRKLSAEKAAALNRKRDLVEGSEPSWWRDRTRALPGRGAKTQR